MTLPSLGRAQKVVKSAPPAWFTGEVSKVRDLSLEGFVAYVKARPRKLGCWRDRSAGTYPALGWLNVHPVVRQRSLMAEIGPVAAVAMTTASSHNQVGIAAGWVIQHMRGPGRATPTPEQDRLALWSPAAQYWALRNLIIEIRVGLRSFESTELHAFRHDIDAARARSTRRGFWRW